MRASRTLFAAWLVTFAGAAAAMTGNDLHKYMIEDEGGPTFLAGVYSGYVVGVYNAYTDVEIICPPSGVTNGQVKAIVSKYLKANPEMWAKPALDIVTPALVGAFPCKKK